MGMEHLMSATNPSSGLIHHRNVTMEKMKELQKLRTETMMKTCHHSTESRDGAIRCPIPHKSGRSYWEYDFKAAQDLSDFIVSKVSFSTVFCDTTLFAVSEMRFNFSIGVFLAQASPPHFMGSPPVRASNPLVHDTQFCAWKVQSVDQSIGVPIPTKGCNVGYYVRKGSVTKA